MARLLLDNWETQRHFFWHIMPKDNVVQIEAATEGSAESEDEEEVVKA
jgi:glutamate synthase domain-containing protein 3